MRTAKRNLARAAILSVAWSVVLLACNSDAKKSEAQKAEEAVREKFGEQGLIRAEVVVRAYEQGRLGTREQVEADMEPFFSPPDLKNKIPKPFDSSGKLIPLSDMTDEQIRAFGQWWSSGKVYGIVREEMNAAIIEHRAKKARTKD